jgi:diaminohydroxyphosphoribosylaminopyrimidine deaminase / 5-amino-6-(5-phosphoribosylamino)uracil reductase
LSDRDQQYMGQALRLARRARGRTSPNPLVGAVLVKGKRVVGEGYHRRAGQPHAEVIALEKAGNRARGAELFVNLEPCNHLGLTGPCSKAIIDAGIKRVVIGMVDPNPRVNGRGVRALKKRGIEVVTGVMGDACEDLNSAFLSYILKGRPEVTFKTAVTLDGRVAGRHGDSRWVTGDKARAYGHRLRHEHDVLMVGVGTVIADDPQLTCRHPKHGLDPWRVVVDSRLRTPPNARVVEAIANSPSPTLFYTTDKAAKSRIKKLRGLGAEVVVVPAEGKAVSVAAMLADLAGRGRLSVLLEGGPRLTGSFWEHGLIDRVVTFIAPKLIGDPRALPPVNGGARKMAEAMALEDLVIKRLGDDVMIAGRVAGGL